MYNTQFIIEPITRTINISQKDLDTQNITGVRRLYQEELKWDTFQYYRSIHFQFPAMSDKADIDKWYKTLIIEVPEFLFYLVKSDLKKALCSFMNEPAQFETVLITKHEIFIYVLESLKEFSQCQMELQVVCRHLTFEIKKILKESNCR